MPSAASSRTSRLRFSEATALLTLLLALVFVLGFEPVARRASLMDQPLRHAWEAFARTNQSSLATAGVPEDRLPARLEAIQATATELDDLRRLAFQRIELTPEVADRIQAPFQLIDFDNERLRIADELAALGKAKKVPIQPAALGGLPRYPSESAPAFLWPRLHIAQQALLTAAHCEVAGILELSQLPPVTHRSPMDGRRLYEELRMRLEVAGAAEPLGRFLTSLPLRGEELKATGLAEILTNKPALFVSQLLMRKAAPDRPNDARLELVISGFVPSAGPRRAL